jgi:hypothetical protein
MGMTAENDIHIDSFGQTRQAIRRGFRPEMLLVGRGTPMGEQYPNPLDREEQLLRQRSEEATAFGGEMRVGPSKSEVLLGHLRLAPGLFVGWKFEDLLVIVADDAGDPAPIEPLNHRIRKRAVPDEISHVPHRLGPTLSGIFKHSLQRRQIRVDVTDQGNLHGR